MACKGCKKSEVECEECPEWIFTFADLVMLMMGFFVILWVLKPAPGKEGGPKQALPTEVIAAIRGGLGYLPDPNSEDPVDAYMLLQKIGSVKVPAGPGDGGKTRLEQKSFDGTDPEVTSIRQGKQAAVGGRLLFAPGDAAPSAQVKAALDQIARQIRGHRNIVLVKGHSSLDDLPEQAPAQQRMDLSLRRAQAVADYLIKAGVEADIFRVQGCSTFEPVAERAYTADVRALNRRVEVEVTATLVNEFQDPPKSAPTTVRSGS